MKIVFIIDQVYKHGGIERVLSIKANYLANINTNIIHIVTMEQNKQAPCYDFNSNIIFDDLNINYKKNKSYFHPVNLLKLPGHILKAIHYLNRVKPDIIVVCSHSADTYFMPFIKKNIPKIKEFHYSKHIEIDKRKKSSSFFKKLFFKFADFVETKYDKLVILNKDEATYYRSNNTVIIPNPLTFYPKTVSQLNNPIVMSAGRIAPVKRFDRLIDIWELVHTKCKSWQLHIYGSGDSDYIELLQSKINSKKLQDVVVLKGPTNSIQKKMLCSSLFVMTSDNECFPLVLLEAQACGLPIVSFDCPNGPRNIINTENGKLIAMNENIGFSEAVLNVIADSSKRRALGANARKNAANFTIEIVMKQWLILFEELKPVII